MVRGKTIGMINVSSCRENAFSEGDIKLIYTIANQTSNSIERLQAVITAEKSKMESMVESMTEGVVMVDERGDVMVANPRARQMLSLEFEGQIPAKIWKEKTEVIGLEEGLKKCEDDNCLVSKDLVVSVQGGPVSLHCDTAPVRNEKGEIMVLLSDCSRESALIVEGRLQQVLEDVLAKKGLAKEISLRFGLAVYPDDAKGDEELIKKARGT